MSSEQNRAIIRRFVEEGINFENGKIVERWANSDELGMLRQLGAIPTPDQVAA